MASSVSQSSNGLSSCLQLLELDFIDFYYGTDQANEKTKDLAKYWEISMQIAASKKNKPLIFSTLTPTKRPCKPLKIAWSDQMAQGATAISDRTVGAKKKTSQKIAKWIVSHPGSQSEEVIQRVKLEKGAIQTHHDVPNKMPENELSLEE